ncbi:hypothetical protein PHSY_004437 [Pseudozyma hubeiensis SY62]|uniref:Uncharacterized protein n=1 Tax=Pseudozyma hubeiensis (strain SY62) TaxID=1305764 RepID=R9P638_PSEHS|nr:hypothetical protein PHSY_004437 [Pseudozyma hubeiensis SY62]GAC96853.1 hypothetical protein PHSY_004437 [Pseudozyma hubeiensis SY62]
MDSDPFAVWDDPASASTSAASTSAAKRSKEVPGIEADKENVRLSLEYEDEDPGWGAASASNSRANSPEKTRKQVSPSRAAADAARSPTSEVQTLEHTSDLARLTPTEDASSSMTEVKEEAVTIAPPAVEQGIAAETPADKPAAEALAEPDEEEDDDIDTFEDSRQDQAEHIEHEVTPQEFDAKVTIAADSSVPPEDDDGFDDFGEPAGVGEGAAANDDFGDFDDFETGDAQDDDGFGNDDFGDDGLEQPTGDAARQTPAPALAYAAPPTTRDWAPLQVTAKSSRIELANSVNALLPLSAAAEKSLDTTALRQVGGPSQVLVSPESRQLWADLSSFPSVKPIDWVRSKTRRDYLISMGVPVNLDEIHSSFASGSGGSKQLPPLQLKYESSAAGRASGPLDSNGSVPHRSSSLKLAGTSAPASAAQRSASASNSPRNGNSSPALGSSTNRERMVERRMQELGLGPAPAVDLRRAQELVNKTEDQLTLLSLPALKSMLRDLNTITTSTSSLLTHHLTLRESYQADSEMYNSMIKELVTGAASRFSSGSGSGGSNSVAGGRGDSRRSTTMGMNASSSGKARVNSLPAASAAMSGTRSMSPSLRGGAATSPRR